MKAINAALALDVRVHRMRLEVDINNHGIGPVRIWDRNNSWGWETLMLEVGSSSQQYANTYVLAPKPRIWTRNGPGFIEIPGGGSHLVVITPGNPEWRGLDRIETLRGEMLRVRAKLSISPSPEAATYGVFVGEVSSSWQESEPPHLWLFSGA